MPLACGKIKEITTYFCKMLGTNQYMCSITGTKHKYACEAALKTSKHILLLSADQFLLACNEAAPSQNKLLSAFGG